MSHSDRSRTRRTGIIAIVISGLFLAGCTANSGVSGTASTSDTGTPQIIGNQSDGGSPVEGGTLNFASASPVAKLDPITGSPSGLLGGTEMAAIYDTLVRWEPTTQNYEPQLAKSLTQSDDHLTWTLGLRDGVSFSDGTVLDAAAVVDSTNRYNAGKGASSDLFNNGVTSVVATDPATVVYTLNRPWPEFPSLLTFGHGMITTANSYAGEQFTPIGAGPFIVDQFSPGSELVLSPKSDYWGGKPKIDKLKFVDISGSQAKIEALQSGGIQMTLLRQPDAVATATTMFPGYLEPVSVIDAGQINTREGHPGSDVRVRKALALAVDADVLNGRVHNGKMNAATDLFPSGSKWHGNVSGLSYDPDQAKTFLDEAKADGYDGNISFVTPQTPEAISRALAVQAMWQAVGFNVEIKYLSSTTDQVRTLYITHDFDVSSGGNGVWDAAPMSRLYSSLASGSARNTGGFSDPETDRILGEIMSATNDSDKLAAIDRLQTEINATVPIMVWGAGNNFVPWTDNVHGAKPGLDSLVLFDKVWLSK